MRTRTVKKRFSLATPKRVCEIEQPCNQRIGGHQLRLHHQADDGNDRRQSQQSTKLLTSTAPISPKRMRFSAPSKSIYPPKDASRGGGMARIFHGSATLKQPFDDGFHRVSLGLGLVIADDAVPQDRRRHGLHILDVGTEFAVQRRIDFGAHD